MNIAYRRIAYMIAFALLGVYGFFTLRGPHGVPALLERRNQIRQLEVENANLAQENEDKRKRIRKLDENSSQVELEIRDKLQKMRPGETQFILPGSTKPVPLAPDRATPE